MSRKLCAAHRTRMKKAGFSNITTRTTQHEAAAMIESTLEDLDTKVEAINDKIADLEAIKEDIEDDDHTTVYHFTF